MLKQCFIILSMRSWPQILPLGLIVMSNHPRGILNTSVTVSSDMMVTVQAELDLCKDFFSPLMFAYERTAYANKFVCGCFWCVPSEARGTLREANDPGTAGNTLSCSCCVGMIIETVKSGAPVSAEAQHVQLLAQSLCTR